MDVAWQDGEDLWSGELRLDSEGYWRLWTEVPVRDGRHVRVVPITGSAGPHIEVEAVTVESGEDVLVAAWAAHRFWSRIELCDVDLDTDQSLYVCMTTGRRGLLAA